MSKMPTHFRSSFGFFLLLVGFGLAGLSWTARAEAQEAIGAQSPVDELNINVGYLLPSKIPNFTTDLPLIGVRYDYGLSFASIEVEAQNAHSYGSDWTSFGVGLRGMATLFPGTHALVFAGLDETSYRPPTDDNRIVQMGIHMGGGLLMQLIGHVYFRADARIMSGPGSTLYTSLGLTYRGL